MLLVCSSLAPHCCVIEHVGLSCIHSSTVRLVDVCPAASVCRQPQDLCPSACERRWLVAKRSVFQSSHSVGPKVTRTHGFISQFHDSCLIYCAENNMVNAHSLICCYNLCISRGSLSSVSYHLHLGNMKRASYRASSDTE